jgi:hypothetical protein
MNITGTNGGAYVAIVVAPDANTPINAADVQIVAEGLANQTAFLNDPFLNYENNSANVRATTSFVMTKSLTVATSVPTGGAGYTAPTIWTTPSVPWILEGALIEVTGNCTADANPATVQLTLNVNSVDAVNGLMDPFSAGTFYSVNGTTSNPTIFGLKLSEKGTLLSQPLTDSSTDSLGFGLDEVNLTVAAPADGGANGLWGKAVTLNVTHGSVADRTLSIPIKVTMWGRIIA